jgi:hypothetical protein
MSCHAKNAADCDQAARVHATWLRARRAIGRGSEYRQTHATDTLVRDVQASVAVLRY